MRINLQSRYPVVVAVDGSPASVAALRWADAVVADHSELRVVTAHRAPTANVDFLSPVSVHWEMMEEGARIQARAAIIDALGHDDVEHVVAAGSIESVLADQRDASMIVMGTRPRRTLLSRIRPSATNRVTGMVDCTVVSVPSGGGPWPDQTQAAGAAPASGSADRLLSA
ncbi:MAG: universal stress protein [Acidimicrobiales bacterium]